MTGLDIILIGVHTDGKEIALSRRFEHTLARSTCDLIDDIRALVVLAEGGFKAQAWVGEVKAEIAHQYFAVRADLQNTLFVTIKELVQTWRIATDDRSHRLGFGK